MCRVALINKKGLDYINKEHDLEQFFNHLEDECGGHGNGYCAIGEDGRILRLHKGINLTNKTIADEINALDGVEWVIYHTRIASAGSIKTANCHPFYLKGSVLACNGTEWALSQALKSYKINMTDSEALLRLNYDNLIDGTKTATSVCIGLFKGKVFANRNCGQLKYITPEEDAIIFASSFPYNWTEQIFIAQKSWTQDEKLNGIEEEKVYYSGGFNWKNYKLAKKQNNYLTSDFLYDNIYND